MIRKSGELTSSEKEGLQGGNGVIKMEHILEQDKGEFYGKGRLCAMLTIPPGGSVGYHVHKGETECFYVLEGEAVYSDNGTETIIKKGDATVCPPDTGHSLENKSDSDLKVLAVILFTE